jgi:hypothetical protein
MSGILLTIDYFRTPLLTVSDLEELDNKNDDEIPGTRKGGVNCSNLIEFKIILYYIYYMLYVGYQKWNSHVIYSLSPRNSRIMSAVSCAFSK